MAYGPNTSRTNRLPHGFFENLYAKLEESGDILKTAADGQFSFDTDELIDIIRFYDTQLRVIEPDDVDQFVCVEAELTICCCLENVTGLLKLGVQVLEEPVR